MNLFEPQMPNDVMKETIKECMFTLIDEGLAEKRSQIRQMDTIDVTRYAEGKDYGNDASLPEMHSSEEETAFLQSQWSYMIPPLKSGVIVLNKARYLVFDILGIDCEKQSYELNIYDYALDMGTWLINCVVNSYIQYTDGNLLHSTSGIDMYDLFTAVFIDGFGDRDIVKLDSYTLGNLKKNLLPTLKENKWREDDYRDVVDHFLHAVTKVNMELASGPRPKASRKNHAKVKAIAGEVEKTPKPQIIRTLQSGGSIKSVNIPKAPTLEIIRRYKIAEWNVRGHIRRLKSGKIAYIRPGVRKRKCLQNAGESVKPQTIIRSVEAAS